MVKKTNWVIGIDEAGRGPLAGPVTLGCVMCPKRIGAGLFRGIKDSKHLSAKAREEWFEKIRAHPRVFFASVSVGPALIDREGIVKAVNRGVAGVLRKVAVKRCDPTKDATRSNGAKVFLDGSLRAPEKYAQKTIIKGDEKVPVISAASVVAKVTRDAKMTRMARKFPPYFFETHKGYGTKLHYKMIRKHGFCEIHRKTFLRDG